jgi:hypothetical protein
VCQIGTGVDDLPIGKTGETTLRSICCGAAGGQRQSDAQGLPVGPPGSEHPLLEDRNIFEMQMRRTHFKLIRAVH